jgi:hypothetical protein
MMDSRAQALGELDAALEERDLAQERFESAIGTSTEFHAYQRLRRATRRLTQADHKARRFGVGDRDLVRS